MKRLFKKLATIVSSLMLCVFMCTGCSVIEVDNYKYYHDTVVVTVGDIEFTMNDLIVAFNNYGRQYYENNGYTMENAIKATATSMVERELLLREIIKESETNEYLALDDKDYAYIRQEAWSHMQDTIDSYEATIRKEMEIDEKVVEGEDATTEEEEPLRKEKTEYTPTVVYEDGMVKRVPTKVEYAITDTVPMHFEQIITDEEVSNEAMTRYIKDLQDAAKSEGRPTSESEVLEYEEDRLISILTKNRYLEKFEHYFMSSLNVDTTTVVEYYKTQYEAQKAIYSNDISAYHTAMKDYTSKHVFYHPKANGEDQYVNINHILIKFTKDQTDRIARIEGLTGYKKGTAEYQAELEKIARETTTTFIDEDGNEVTRPASYVENLVTNYVNGATTLKSKARRFEEMMYRFNDDEGNMNSDFYYVVNLDPTVEDQMVKEFADTARALHGEVGAGGVSKMIITDYGYHILFDAGVVENITDDIDTLTYEDLFRNYTNASQSKSLFNYFYDKLSLDKNAYNNRSQEILDNIFTTLKEQDITIKYYEYRYQDLWK